MRRLLIGVLLLSLLAPPGGAGTDLRDVSPVGLAGSDTAALAAVGDVNGDGRQDVAVGLQHDRRTSDLTSLSAITVVGDRRPEWIIGAAIPEGVVGVGGELPSGAYVVFSTARGEVRPGRAGQPVVTVDARGRGEHAGRSVPGLPDATGDGVADLLVGLPDANANCRHDAGAIALVPGRRTLGRVRVGRRTPRVDGPYPGAELGENVAFGAGELFAGTGPSTAVGSLDLWRVPVPPRTEVLA